MVVAALTVFASCGQATAPNSFPGPADGGAAGTPAVGQTGGRQVDAGSPDPTIGHSCEDDGQCDDGIDCTDDECVAALGRCRHEPDHGACADDQFCNGEEICDLQFGCVAGAAVSCSDDDTCTIDSCVESSQSCRHEPRDADADGDPDGNCTGGGDCDDGDPFVSSQVEEICGNSVDDNCDGVVDEPVCTTSQFDVCADALEVEGSGHYELPLAGAVANYAASCAADGWRDVVVAVIAEEAATIDVVASADAGNLAVASFDQCGDAAGETNCARGATSVPRGGTVARLRLDAADAQTFVLKVFSDRDGPVWVDVEYSSPADTPLNETCSTADELPLGVPFVTSIVGRAADLPSACATAQGEAVYELVTSTPVDLEVFAASLDGYGRPVLSLFSDSCRSAGQEVTCREDDPAVLFARRLPAGSHYLGVSATGPSDIQVQAEVRPATVAPDDDDCVAPPLLVAGEAVSLSFVDHADDVALGCLPGTVDSVYALSIDRPADVRLLQRLSDDDRGALALLADDCDPDRALVCVDGTRSPVRAALRDVAPGEYRVVAASQDGTPAEITALVRESSPPTLVANADTCDDAVEIPPAGALLTGNTATAVADYAAGCDRGGVAGGGAPDQVLRLVLDAWKRVVFDMEGSGFETLLDVRRGPSCPGEEVVNGCSAGYVAGRSFLDLTLQPGEYWVQVDGYDGDAGNWTLDVYVVDP